MTGRMWLMAGSSLGFLSVALGAFGAHALSQRLEPALLDIFKTGVQYQFWHALALFFVGLASEDARFEQMFLVWAGRLFLAGTFVFSGSLYILALSGVRIWGAVTPVGGLMFLAGWLCTLVSIGRGRKIK